MSNQFLKLRRSAVPGKIPETSSLDFGEIALNTYDGLAFMKKSGSSGEQIVTIGSTTGNFTGSFSGSFIGSLQGTSSWANNSISSSYSLNATSASFAASGNGSFSGSFSGSLFNLKGTVSHIPYFSQSQVLDDSTMFQVDNGGGAYSIAINQNGVSGFAPEALFVYQPSSTSYNVISGKGNLNNYLQLNIQNENNGANASSDIVATANNGSETTNYIDMGINGSSFSGFLGGPNDAYLYATGSNFHIGNINPNTHLGFFVGGNDVNADNKFQLNPNNQHEMTGSLDISGSLTVQNITSSLYGTASWAENAITTSFAQTASSADNFLVRGTLTAQTIVAQVITSSTDFVTGSTKFGTLLSNTHQFTGSVNITGSLNVNNSSAILSNQTSSMSVLSASYASGSTSASFASQAANATTASYVLQAVSSSFATLAQTANTASYILNAVSASYASSSTSASYAISASQAQNAITASYLSGYVSPFPYTGSAQITGSLGVTGSVSISGSTGTLLSANIDSIVFTGSFAQSGSVTISGNINATNGITGSLLGTASWAQNAVTASYILNAVSASYALSASNAQTASYVLQAVSASYASASTSASFATQAANATTASYVLNAVSASFASQAANSTTASYIQNAQSASYVLQAVSAAFATQAANSATASYILNAVSASYASASTSASYALQAANAQTASYVENAQTASYVLQAVSASFVTLAQTANTASYILNAVSSSYASSSTSASYALTSSYVENAQTASYVLQAVSASYALNSTSASFATQAANAFTASYVQNAQTASYVLNAISSSYASSSTSASYALQATNADTASYVLQAISASFATLAQTANTASYILNAVSASYASASTSASFASTASSADNFLVRGTLTAQTIVAQVITSSTDFVTGSTRFGSIITNTHQFTGSISVSGSITGTNGVINDLTASNASNAITASYALTAISASYASASTSASYALQATNANTASYVQNAQTASYVLQAVSASFATLAQTANTASYILNAVSASYASASTSASYALTATSASYASSSTSASFSTQAANSFTASYVQNAQSASYVLQAVSASYASASTSASYANTASYVLNAVSSSYALSASYALNASSSLVAQTASYGLNIIISGSVNNADYIDFNTSASFTAAVGRLGYDSGEGTLTFGLEGGNVTLKIGSDLYQYVYNNTTASMTLGQVVYISGSQGNRIAVKLASATAEQGSANTLGFVAETIPAGSEGWVMTEGNLRKLNTIGLIGGQLIYLSTTPGTYTQTPPVAPNHGVRLGYAERIDATVGSIYVKIDNGYELGELHDVIDSTTSSSYGDLFIKSGSVWINSKQLTGSYGLTGSLQATSFTGSLLGTSSYASNANLLDGLDSTIFATTGSNIFVGNQTVTGSLFTTGSNTLIGSTTLTGSLNITGSTTQTGNNTLLGNTTLSGSIIISGALGTNNPTVKIYGDTTHNGYVRFDPVTTNIDQSISASYIYVSGSTNDLYFSQNGNGYANTTRLRWLEGNLYTGLLNGGLITITTGSTWFNLSSGSGVIVNLNASLNDNPYPTIQYINWGNFVSQSITYLTSSVQSYIGINSSGQITQQTTPFVNGEYNTQILIGTVLHQNQATVNASITYPSVAYGYKQRTYDFIKAFGPLKLSGYTINPSSSLGLTIGGGTAFADGRNYQVDPNNPSYITDVGTTVSKIFRYYQSGSTFIQDTNAGAGYTVIDPANYNNNGTLTAVLPATPFTIQRIFWYPNSATKGIVVYYGNAQYASIADAAANINFETFSEVENTKQNAVYLGAIIIKYNGVFTNTADYSILPGGIFRSVGGAGGGGSTITTRLVDLSDVAISGPTGGQALVYNSTTTKWENLSYISASISGNSATATSAQTASYVLQAVSASFATNAVNATTASYVLQAVSASFATLAQTANTASYVLQAVSASNANLLDGLDSTVFATTGSNVFRGNQTITGSVAVTGSLTVVGSISGSNFTGSLLGTATTASYVLQAVSSSFATLAQTANTASYVLQAVSASYASASTSASFATQAANATTASYILNAVSASFASTASSADNFLVRGTLTAQTIVAQVITSSTDFVTGSTKFGTLLVNTHQFTGSVSVTGSLAVNGSNVILTNQTSSMSVLSASYASGSTSASFVSQAQNAVTASYKQ